MLKDKNAVVTGATGIISGVIARALASAGVNVPITGFGTPEAISTTAVYLCSSSAAAITGTAIPVDGGWTSH